MKTTNMLAKMAAATVTIALLATALLVVPAASPAQAHPSTFPDVTETNPAHDAIESLVSRGILEVVANGNFQPNAALSRGQVTKILVTWRGDQIASDPAVAAPAPFTDLDPTYQAYIDTAYAKGWIGGYPDGTFRPNTFLTREQMAIVTVRSLGLETTALALTGAQVSATLRPFLDEVAVTTTARPYVAFAVIRGLIAGDTGRLNPLALMTRAQFALVLSRADGLEAALAAGTTSLGTAGSVPAGAASSGDAAATAPTLSPEEQRLADFMDRYLFQPRNSPVTGAMVLQNADWYGIPPLSQLVIMSAETSLGDPQLGGTLARRNNFGCMRYHGADTAWGLLSNGRIWVAGKDWYSFATPQLGMAAWGRYLKLGVNGFYLPVLAAADPDWERFAAVYYGRGVSGFTSYVNRLNTIENRFRAMAAEQGVSF